jgi:hypothetical protein
LEVGFDGSLFPVELNCFKPSLFQTNLISGRSVGRQQHMTALPASALHLELFEKRNEIPIDFKTGPDHQINSTPGWICQIYCDDFGEANDGDKASKTAKD